MRIITSLLLTLSALIVGYIVFSQTTKTLELLPPQKKADPVVNFRVSLPQASQIIYAIRYSSILNAQEANQLADFLVQQANDTTLNKPIQPNKQK